MLDRKRKSRASTVLAEIIKRDKWTSIKMAWEACHMGHEAAAQALDDLLAAGKVVVRDVVVGKDTKNGTGKPIVARYFATPEAAKRLSHVDIAVERVGRRGAEHAEKVEAMRHNPATYPKLTRAENQLAGAQMERLKLLASRMRAGEQMGTADLAECMLVGGWVSQITTAPMAAIDMACKLRDKARKMMRAER